MSLKRNIDRLLSSAVSGFGPTDDGGAGLLRMNGIVWRIIVSWGCGWDHVSVSSEARCPTFEELDHIKRLLWEPGDTVIEYHVPAPLHINNHPNCLHLWRPQSGSIPLPPTWMVGVPGLECEK
jgi:hypothetical protein